MLPDFLIIGAHKAGTTSLHHYFSQHPQVFMTVVKEPNHFSFDPTNTTHVGDASGQFRARTPQEYERLFDSAPAQAKRGEASPSYLFSPLAPGRIRQELPHCRLIASLRNPVDRTYSAYQMAVRSGRTNIKVEDLVPERDPWFQAGLYSKPLRIYMDSFEREQFKVILFDDLNSKPGEIMSELFGYIGVDAGFPLDTSYRFNPGGLPSRPILHRFLNSFKRIPGLQEYAPTGLRNALRVMRDKNLKRADQLSVDIKAKWLEFFRDDISKTQDLIDRDLAGWFVVDQRRT